MRFKEYFKESKKAKKKKIESCDKHEVYNDACDCCIAKSYNALDHKGKK